MNGVEEVISQIENDINYFKNLGFVNLVSKFERDLQLIVSLINNNEVKNNE